MYVYKITNIINNKCYIGITNDVKKRWRSHKYVSICEEHPEYNKVLYRAIRKYSIDNFKFEIIEEVDTINEAKDKEVYYIKYYNSLAKNQGYNVTPGGDYCEEMRSVGELNSRAKLSEKEVKDIINRRENAELYSDVYSIYKNKIGKAGFNDIWIGKSWKHLQPEIINLPRLHNRALTPNQVREIRNLLKENKLTGRQIADLYNINTSLVSQIKHNKRYKDVL